MDDVLDELHKIAHRCRQAAATLDAKNIARALEGLARAATEVGKAASGSFAGYQANIYLKNFRPKTPADYYDAEYGRANLPISSSRGPWMEYDPAAVASEIYRRAGVSEVKSIEAIGQTIATTFEECRAELLPTLDALLFEKDDRAIAKLRKDIERIRAVRSVANLARAMKSGIEISSHDSEAIAGGICIPPHVRMRLWVESQRYNQRAIVDLLKNVAHLIKYREKTRKMKGRAEKIVGKKIFIGHGRSPVWRELTHFLQDRLALTWDEFNRESTPGITTTARIEAMLDDATFAFIVMTAEDEQADHTKHARANVIHEVGLFQGRLGFNRAIVLLEDGCEEFSNIVGLGQIRFPKGKLAGAFEEIRRVLEREKVIVT